jgi:hypothetical protein
VPPAAADAALELLRSRGVDAWVCGSIAAAG